MEKLAQGTVVQLKSGGPNMLVIRHDEDTGRYLCVWVDDDALRSETFISEVIEVISLPGKAR